MSYKTAFLILLLASAAHAQTWDPEVSIATISSAFEAAPIDANGDGIDDVILVGNSLVVALNDGSGSFTTSTVQTGVNTIRDIDVADFDGDGNQDIIYCSRNFVTIRFGDGTGAFSTELTLEQSGNAFFCDSAVGDLEGDGDLDVVVLSVTSGFVGYYENTGTATMPAFAPRVDLHLMPTGQSFNFGGLEIHADGGSNPDILFASPVADMVGLIPNNGSLAFGSAQSIVSGNVPTDIDLTDLDGDGDQDLLVGGNTLEWIEAVSVGFVFVHPITYGSAVTTLDTADFDGDGNEDIVVNGSNQVAWLPGNGSGTFGASALVPATVSNSRGVLANDFTGNGFADVIATGFNSQDFNLVLNRPDYPGTTGDLELLSGINGPTNGKPTKQAGLGDVLSLELRSPGGSMVGELNTLIVGQVFPTGQQLNGPFHGIDFDPSLPLFLVFDSTVDGPLGAVSIPLPSDGFAFTATLPAGFAGSSIFLQGYVLTSAAANAIFESTVGHVLVGI